ncbi:putative ATP-dependent RNA helicase TDRD9 [Thelohanellus kitauei]|uniref:Putative ATP-dependent RNA helicase TDRD9 n=1 Tax=Thelohanellus kitauei TaxID=669202 RepID=A0A0C2J1B7_THEKT|nr:putative ATP-dependent RNA helicase TDRD9 [Thelohanellus kitauei]
MVAADVSITSRSAQVLASETTIFPENIGLCELLTLLFAPFALMRPDLHNKRYLGALCGLGYDIETRQSLFPQNDVEFLFPFRFTNDDLHKVNGVRTYISNTLGVSIEQFSAARLHIKTWRDKVIENLMEYTWY